MDTEERKALIGQYRDGYAAVAEALLKITPEEIDARPAPNKWTAREIVHHLADSEMTWWGVGAVQKIDAAAMDVYLAYRQYTADVRMGDSNFAGDAVQIPGGLEDIWYIQAGARIQF